MDDFTAGLTVPAGLAARAYWQARKRRRNSRVLVAGGLAIVLADGATAAAVVFSGPRPAAAQRIETAAYVIPQVRHALTVAGSDNVVVDMTMGHVPPLTWRLVPGQAVGFGSNRPGAAPAAQSYETMISYGAVGSSPPSPKAVSRSSASSSRSGGRRRRRPPSSTRAARGGPRRRGSFRNWGRAPVVLKSPRTTTGASVVCTTWVRTASWARCSG